MPDGTGFSGDLGLKGQPGPQNVRGGVDVRLGGVAARLAAELCLGGAVPGGGVPASAAPAGCIAGIDLLDDYASGAFSLGTGGPQTKENHADAS
jgi:hypothetical protein